MQIQRSFKENHQTGTLYLVPTPIGNLQDMTQRAVEVLDQVTLICAEDTRHTGLLLKHFDIKTRQVSFHEHNALERIPDLIARLQAGQSLAQVSDAGMPSISDPGHELVKAAILADIPVVALPGPSAGLTALIASGLAPQPHAFYGFLPRKKSQQTAFFERKKHYPETQIFYESPNRLVDTLETMRSIYGNREVVLVRELTKRYEEYQRGYIDDLLSQLRDQPVKGECLLIVSGFEEDRMAEETAIGWEDMLALIDREIAQGLKPNHAIKQIAKAYGVERQDLYQYYHNSKSKGEN